MMLSRENPWSGSPHRRPHLLVGGAGRHHGVGERVRPSGGPYLLLLLLFHCMPRPQQSVGRPATHVYCVPTAVGCQPSAFG